MISIVEFLQKGKILQKDNIKVYCFGISDDSFFDPKFEQEIYYKDSILFNSGFTSEQFIEFFKKNDLEANKILNKLQIQIKSSTGFKSHISHLSLGLLHRGIFHLTFKKDAPEKLEELNKIFANAKAIDALRVRLYDNDNNIKGVQIYIVIPKIKECLGSFATPLNTVGIGNVTMPTETTPGTIDAAVVDRTKNKISKPKKRKRIRKHLSE